MNGGIVTQFFVSATAGDCANLSGVKGLTGIQAKKCFPPSLFARSNQGLDGFKGSFPASKRVLRRAENLMEFPYDRQIFARNAAFVMKPGINVTTWDTALVSKALHGIEQIHHR